MTSRLVPLALATALAAPATAGSAVERDLWATVNICDTQSHPNELGLRARMPGTGRRERMYMRFIAQYQTDAGWSKFDGGASPWEYAGSARFRYEELGYTFPIDVAANGRYTMRGLIRFEWRAGKRVVRRTSRYTTAGHPARGADPRGFSAATCDVAA